jgi:hypothetical protein
MKFVQRRGRHVRKCCVNVSLSKKKPKISTAKKEILDKQSWHHIGHDF